MRTQPIAALLIICIAGSFAEASDVIELTDESFFQKLDEYRTQNKPIAVEFFAPWCPHCKKLAPTYEEVATALVDKAFVAKVDCTVNSDTCATFGIRGYPTIKVIEGDQMYEYHDAREVDAMVEFITSKGKSAGAPVPKEGTIQVFDDDGFYGYFLPIAFVVLGLLMYYLCRVYTPVKKPARSYA